MHTFGALLDQFLKYNITLHYTQTRAEMEQLFTTLQALCDEINLPSVH